MKLSRRQRAVIASTLSAPDPLALDGQKLAACAYNKKHLSTSELRQLSFALPAVLASEVIKFADDKDAE